MAFSGFATDEPTNCCGTGRTHIDFAADDPALHLMSYLHLLL